MPANVISYFSYKGGAGRSTLAYNTIPLMINEHIHPTKEHPVVVVDMDIDSCGMSYLLGIPAKDIRGDACVQHILKEGCDTRVAGCIQDHAFLKHLIPVGNKFNYADNDAVLFLPAKDNKNINQDTVYGNYEGPGPFTECMRSFIDACENHGVSTVILDSAVGYQATANVSNTLADTIVCCMRPTKQFVDGTVRYLESLDSDEDSPIGGGEKRIIIVPNVIPQTQMSIDGLEYPSTAISYFRSLLSDVLDRDEDDDIQYAIDMMEGNGVDFGIPALPSFMWREGQLCSMTKLDEDEQHVLVRYRKLAGVICDF
ncbi:MAG: hypothetical protein IJC88_03825 [Oscillospiraceae bacterium]|nr:hypothetical protein [Oscillospiraceae bacterium]